MPIYKFRCSDCAHVVETIQRMSERKAPDECTECGHDEFYQVISAPMFVLKGPGWANDGYHYVKTPADDIKGYSDDRKQTILPSRPSDNPDTQTMPDTSDKSKAENL